MFPWRYLCLKVAGEIKLGIKKGLEARKDQMIFRRHNYS